MSSIEARQDRVAPITTYAAIWYFAAVLILLAVFVNIGPSVFINQDYWAIIILLLFGGFFLSVWFRAFRTAETPGNAQQIGRIGLGFVAGLGGLMVFFKYAGKAFTIGLWVPSTLAIGATSAILIQVAVGTVEEGVFRVAIPRVLVSAKRMYEPTAILAANIAFGLFHWGAYQGDVSGMLIAMSVGGMQSLALWTSRSAIGVMLGHTFWNLNASGLMPIVGIYLTFVLVIIGTGSFIYLQRKKIRGRLGL